MQLNRYLAHCGICSRRKAVDLIKAGRVTVNYQVVEQPGHRVASGDRVAVDGKQVACEQQVYVLLNKPRGYVTTLRDPEGRKTVMELVTDVGEQRLYPVGRLDRETTGLLLLTNDGDLAQRLAHPKYEVAKIYHVTLSEPLSVRDRRTIVEGLELEDGPIQADEIQYADQQDKRQIIIALHSGRNRIVRRIFEHFGHEVKKLDRIGYAGLTKKGLRHRQWRMLTAHEIESLKRGS